MWGLGSPPIGNSNRRSATELQERNLMHVIWIYSLHTICPTLKRKHLSNYRHKDG